MWGVTLVSIDGAGRKAVFQAAADDGRALAEEPVTIPADATPSWANDWAANRIVELQQADDLAASLDVVEGELINPTKEILDRGGIKSFIGPTGIKTEPTLL